MKAIAVTIFMSAFVTSCATTYDGDDFYAASTYSPSPFCTFQCSPYGVYANPCFSIFHAVVDVLLTYQLNR
ncbi:MAG: hypothetical protein AB7T49_18180 [Oligoflexales bacterium]